MVTTTEFTQDLYFVGFYGYEDRNLVLTSMGFFYYSCREVFVPEPQITYIIIIFVVVCSILAALVAVFVVAFIFIARN